MMNKDVYYLAPSQRAGTNFDEIWCTTADLEIDGNRMTKY